MKSAMKLPVWWWVTSVVMVILWFSTPWLAEKYVQRGQGEDAKAAGPPATESASSKAPTNYEKMGTLGDTFGALTSLFSVLTTTLVVAGLIHQRAEMKILKGQIDRADKRDRLAAWPRFHLFSETRHGADIWTIVNRGGLAIDCKFEVRSTFERKISAPCVNAVNRPLPTDIANNETHHLEISDSMNPGYPHFEVRVSFTTLEGDHGRVTFIRGFDQQAGKWIEGRTDHYPWEL